MINIIQHTDIHIFSRRKLLEKLETESPDRAAIASPIKAEESLSSEPSSRLECTLCDATFGVNLAWYREKHMAAVHATDDHRCQQCTATFAHELSLKRHVTRVHSSLPDTDKNDEPALLGANFDLSSSDSDLMLQIKPCSVQLTRIRLKDLEPHQIPESANYCRMCQKSYTSNIFKMHNAKIHGDFDKSRAPFSCDQCDAIFVIELTMVTHKYNIHGVKDTRHFQCLKCDKIHDNLHKIHYHLVKKHKVQREKTIVFYKTVIKSDEVRMIPELPQEEERTSYSCTLCKHILTSEKGLRTHMKVVHKNSDHICYICNAPFGTAHALALHMNRSHSNLPFEGSEQCNICKKFVSKASLSYHIRMVHPDPTVPAISIKINIGKEATRKISCTICEAKFSDDAMRVKHQEMVHSNDAFTCAQCSIPFSTQSSLTRHMERAHADVSLPVIQEAPMEIEPLPTEQVRKRKHTSEDEPVPAKRTRSNDDGGSEIIAEYWCDMCQRYYSSENDLKHHQDAIHGGNDPTKAIYKCTTCAAIFVLESSLFYHKKDVHKKVLPEKRKWSKKKLNHRNNRWKEQLEKYDHSDDEEAIMDAKYRNSKNHGCTKCSRRFKKRMALTHHIKYVHKIDHDGKDLSELVENERTCTICNKPTNPRKHAMHQKRDHGIARPVETVLQNLEFECKFCKKSFSAVSQLNRHDKVVHGSFDAALAPFGCNKCPAVFVSEMKLSSHRTAVHKISENRTFECKSCGKTGGLFAIHYHVIASHKKELKREEAKAGDMYECIAESKEEPTETVKLIQSVQLIKDEPINEGATFIPCEHCGIEIHRQNLPRHIRMSHGIGTNKPGEHICEHCNAPFVHARSLTYHISTVHKGGSRCNICNKMVGDIKAHQNKAHGGIGIKLGCMGSINCINFFEISGSNKFSCFALFRVTLKSIFSSKHTVCSILYAERNIII